MSYTIADVQSDLEGILHGTTINKIKNPYNLYYRAAREFLADIDAAETRRTALITNALYDQVTRYALPSDLKGNRVIDIFPQALAQRGRFDQFDQNYSKTFALRQNNLTFSIDSNGGIKTIEIIKDLTPATLLNESDSITANGTWSVGGTASNLAVDTLNYLTGSASLSFDTAASGTSATFLNTTMTAVDLTSHLGLSTLFVWVYIPSTASVSSIALNWGDDVTSNYWTNSVTSGFNQAFTAGWNLLGFSWASATKVGTPTVASVNALQLTFTTTNLAVTGWHVDSFCSNLGTLYNIKYYSKFLFSNSSGTWIEKPTDQSDVINLDTDSYNVYLFKVAEYACQQISEAPNSKYGGSDALDYKSKYDQAKMIYKRKYKTEASTPSQNYYTFGSQSNAGIFRFNNTRRND